MAAIVLSVFLFAAGIPPAGVLQADLAISQFAATAQGRAGDPIYFGFLIENRGSSASGEFSCGLFISVTEAHAYGIRIASGDFESLPAGAGDFIQGDTVVPAGLEPGIYYLIAAIDSDERTADADRQNNAATQLFELYEDRY